MRLSRTVKSVCNSIAAGRPNAQRRVVIVLAAGVALAALPGATLGASAETNTVAAPVGMGQSPIDFRANEITFVDRLARIRFSYPDTDVTLVNTGSPDEFATVRADVPASAAYMILRGVRYDLLQFHWHAPSEHEIDGRKTPLEMHFVHRSRADGSLLVIGVFIEQGRRNHAAEPIFRELPELPDETRSVAGVKLPGLLPDDRESFRYSGSLTTPPFTEGVQWIVLADAISFSDRQIAAFRELFEEGNSREVQPLNGRQILSDADDVFEDDFGDDDIHDDD
jgi:carbonic anhydrase